MLTVIAVLSDSPDLRICLLVLMLLAIALTNLAALVICWGDAMVLESLALDTLYSLLMLGIAARYRPERTT